MALTFPTGTKILLTCQHTRIVKFNDSHDSEARFWCDACDGMRGFAAKLIPVTEPRSSVTTYPPACEGNGTARRWTRVIRGKLYSFTAVTMPNGELRYFANRFDGKDSRFDCEWTHEIISWTFPRIHRNAS